MLNRNNGKSTTCFLLCSQQRVFFAEFGKTRTLLGNPDTPIERSHTEKLKKKKNDRCFVSKIQLDEHDKFRYYVMFATIDMLI
jgi:hypothetical protein